MGGEGSWPNLEELARRLEALEQDNRELREALGSGASNCEPESPQQQSQVTRAREPSVASSKTVRSLLLGPRTDRAYSRPLAGVLPSYVVGWLLTCASGAYGAYVAFLVALGSHGVGTGWLGLAPLAALFFGAYGGIRDGSRFVFARFQYVGLITAIGTTVVVFCVSLGIAHWFWTPAEYRDMGFVLRELITDELNPFVLGAIFVATWLLFVSGALLGTAIQLWASEKERVGRKDPARNGDAGRSASTSVVKTQVWLGFAGTVLAALIALVGTLFGGQ
jgi:hypothetical protein